VQYFCNAPGKVHNGDTIKPTDAPLSGHGMAMLFPASLTLSLLYKKRGTEGIYQRFFLVD